MPYLSPRSCSIVTIGDELISGYRLDTNSKWLAKELHALNISVDSIISIGDNFNKIIKTLTEQSSKKLDYIFVTGGLGPTEDDKTLDSIKAFLNSEYLIDEDYIKVLSQRFNQNSDFDEMIKNQSRKIKGVRYIENSIGTALPFSFIKSGTKVFVFPGVPQEFKLICKRDIFPEIGNKNRGLIDCVIQTSGIGESRLSDRVSKLINKYSDRVKFSFLPKYAGVTLRLTAEESNLRLLNKAKEDIINRIGEYYFSDNDMTLEEFVLNQLRTKDLTLGVAESCTGGTISKLITGCPGSSDVFKGGIISYSNKVKENNLKISCAKLKKYGAVSKEISEEMCDKVSKILNTDVSISCTGISGPSGGSKDKPIGLVFISVKYLNRIYTKKYNFLTERAIHRELTANTALNMLRLTLSRKSL